MSRECEGECFCTGECLPSAQDKKEYFERTKKSNFEANSKLDWDKLKSMTKKQRQAELERIANEP